MIQNWNWKVSVISKNQRWIVNHVEERTGVHGIVQNSMVKSKKLEEHGNAILRRYIFHLFERLKKNSILQ